MIYLTLPELLHVTERTLGPGYGVRDYGLLEAALARPQATAFGKDAYPDLDAKAAALLHSIARNHALIDGNKRLALAAVIAFYGLNGRRLTLTNDQAYELVVSVAAGQLDAADAIAAVLHHATEPRRESHVAGSRTKPQIAELPHAGTSLTCLLRLCHTAVHSGPAKYAGRGTGLTVFAAARSPLARARNTGAAKCTMRACCGGRLSRGSACSSGSTGQACQDHSPEAIQCPIPAETPG